MSSTKKILCGILSVAALRTRRCSTARVCAGRRRFHGRPRHKGAAAGMRVNGRLALATDQDGRRLGRRVCSDSQLDIGLELPRAARRKKRLCSAGTGEESAPTGRAARTLKSARSGMLQSGLPCGRSWKLPGTTKGGRNPSKMLQWRAERRREAGMCARTVLVRLAILVAALALVKVLVASLRAEVAGGRVLLVHHLVRAREKAGFDPADVVQPRTPSGVIRGRTPASIGRRGPHSGAPAARASWRRPCGRRSSPTCG